LQVGYFKKSPLGRSDQGAVWEETREDERREDKTQRREEGGAKLERGTSSSAHLFYT